MAVTWKKLAYEENVVLKSLYDAHSVLMAVTDNTPEVLAVAADGIVGRLASANIASLTPANVRTIINVEDGADVTDATNVGAAGAIMETDIVAKGDLIVGSAANTATILPVGTLGQVLKVGAANLVGWATDGFVNVANATERLALTPVLGKTCFQVDELAPYVCTVIA